MLGGDVRAARSAGSARLVLWPGAVDIAPHAAGVGVCQFGRKTVGADIVVTVQRREAGQGGGDADRCETRVSGCRIWTAMIHRRADGHAGGHLVVEQATDLLPQNRGDTIVQGIVAATGVGVETACEIAG